MISMIYVTYGKVVEIWDIFKIKVNANDTVNDFKSVMIHPFGLYGKPRPKENILIWDNGKFIIPLTDHKKLTVDLEYGDVVMTDYKSSIRFDYSKGNIYIDSNDVVINCRNFKVKADLKIEFNSIGLGHNSMDVGSTHTHPETGTITLTPAIPSPETIQDYMK